MSPSAVLLGDWLPDWIHIGPELVPKLEAPLWVFSVLLLGSIVGLFLWRRYKKKIGQLRELAPGSLRRIWSAFIRQVPGEFRPYVLLYQPFVVMGEAGSGKSLLIGRYTDWKGQAAQFYPSYSVDPRLQIYLGSRALVFEMPPTLLAETSTRARVALVNLWQPIFKKRDPIVIVTFSATALKKSTPEALRTQAQTLRGKINVLSRVANKPVEVRIVLTHMDQVEGYLAYSQFVEKNEVPHQLELDPKALDGALDHALEPQETYLPLALTTLSSKNFLKVLTFLNKAPETMANLAILLRTLKEPDPLSFAPEIEALYLTSDQGGSPSAVSNPFASSWADQSLAIEKARLRRHRMFTAAALVAGFAYFGFGFYHEHGQVMAAQKSVATLEAKDDPDQATVAHDDIKVFEGAESSFANFILPTYYRGAPASLRARYVKTIRERYLIPRYRDLAAAGNAPELGLYLTSLIYASSDNELGRYILLGDRSAEWGRVLGLSSTIVRSYVEDSDTEWPGPAPLPPSLRYERASSVVAEQVTWNTFVASIDDLFRLGSINEAQLAGVQATARTLRSQFEAVLRRQTAQDIFQILEKEPHFPRRLFQDYIDDLRPPDWLLRQKLNLDALFDMVLSPESTFELKRLEGRVGLGDLIYVVQAIQAKDPVAAMPITLKFDSQTSSIDPMKWSELLRDGKLRLVVERFIRDNQDSRSGMFFTTPGSYADVVMKPATASDFLFTGRGRVQGIYTRSAYEHEVLSRLIAFDRAFAIAAVDTRVKPIKLDRDVRSSLDSLVQGAAEQYASDYEAAWRAYYASWGIHADSLGSMKIILEHMTLPSSRFEEFLDTVRANTSFDSALSPNQKVIFEKLAQLRTINKIQIAERGQNTELESYRAILRGILTDLDGPPPDAALDAKTAQDMRRAPFEFEQLLTPLGRMAYAILREARDSRRKLVEEWLDKNGLRDRWQRDPFLQPIEELYRLGLQDIEALIQKNWSKRVLSQAVPLIEKFPFTRGAVEDATPTDVDETLKPSTGLFWVAWRNLIAPVCVEDAQGWRPMHGVEQLKWPKGIFDTVSGLARMTRTFWDKDSVPKPLPFEIEPLPLPLSTKPGKPAIILSYLTAGKSSVFGFNQKTNPQTLSVEWWTRPVASVGLQVGDPSTNTKSFRAINEQASAWSFYHILMRDRHAEQNVWVFDMTQGEPEYPPPHLKFRFKEDPWQLFNIPRIEKEETAGHESK